jgi:amidase
LCGVAVEIPATVVVQIDLIKGWSIPGVRLETEDFIMAVGSARPMEDAARMAYRDLIRWLVTDYGFEESEAYFLCTQAGKRARRQHGGPQVFARGLDAENISGLKGTTSWIWD